MTGERLALIALVSVAACPASARAQATPCPASGPWVRVVAPPAGQRADLDPAAVVERLAVELVPRGIGVCAGARGPEAGAPIATVTLASGPRGAAAAAPTVVLDIEVRDAVTAKRVGREIDLSSVPADGRSAVIALAADELMRASWAELSIARARPPAIPLTPVLRAAIAEPERRPAAATLGIGLRGAAEWWTGGLAMYGADGSLDLRVAPRLSLALHAGARLSPGADAPHGSVAGRAFCARAGASVLLTPPGSEPTFGLGARIGGYALRLAGEPAPGAVGASDTSLAISAEVGPELRVRLGDRGLTLVLEASLAAALRGVTVLDAGEGVAGLTGLAGGTSLGLIAEAL